MEDSEAGALSAIAGRLWPQVRMKTFAREVADLSADGSEELLTVSHLTGITPRAEKSVTMFLAESLEGYKRVEPGDLVVNTMWAWRGALGVARQPGIVSPACGVYRFDPSKVDPRFVVAALLTPQKMRRWHRGRRVSEPADSVCTPRTSSTPVSRCQPSTVSVRSPTTSMRSSPASRSWGFETCGTHVSRCSYDPSRWQDRVAISLGSQEPAPARGRCRRPRARSRPRRGRRRRERPTVRPAASGPGAL